MERLSDEEFVKELSILWQNVEVSTRNRLSKIIKDYYDFDNRAEKIIARMQEKIEA